MISDKDRSGWFGASDTRYIMGNYETKSFRNWWLEKLGLKTNSFTNLAMMAGTYYEHKVLDAAVPLARKDHQILIPELKLRINLDGDINDMVYEVKTYNKKNGFEVYPHYEHQVRVQMFAKRIEQGAIISYGLLPKDYKNFFSEIDTRRIGFHPINYSAKFIETKYLPRLRYLCECLELKTMPKNFKGE